MTVARVESYSRGRWTIRGGGQDLRSRKLSEIRKLSTLLGVTSLHGCHEHILDDKMLNEAKDHVWKNREELSQIFEYKQHISKEGVPFPWLKSSLRNSIMKDAKLYVMNRLLRA